MDNNNNGRSQSWTDPITGEIYPSGNPHVTLGKSVTADPSIQVKSFRDPDPEPQQTMQEVYPQGQQTVQQMQRAQTTVQQAQYGNIPQIVERRVTNVPIPNNVTKFCEHCGSVIAKEAVICPTCGCQVAAFQQIQPAVIINNNNNLIQGSGTPKDKWVAFWLCFFFGALGAHRFYEGKMGTGILYLFTGGLFGVGWFVDLIRIACQPKQYFV